MCEGQEEFSCSSTAFLGYIIYTGSISLDPEKVRAVEEWPKPKDHKALQRLLGFTNFYSTIAAHFGKVRFVWDKATEKAFCKLKSRFVSAPILIHPDPKSQFVVDVDASNVGVGAILSQCPAGDSKVHPCAFYSHQLSPAEQNYDIGNKELISVKLALEEW